jgi:hypothetical protein
MVRRCAVWRQRGYDETWVRLLFNKFDETVGLGPPQVPRLSRPSCKRPVRADDRQRSIWRELARDASWVP